MAALSDTCSQTAPTAASDPYEYRWPTMIGRLIDEGPDRHALVVKKDRISQRTSSSTHRDASPNSSPFSPTRNRRSARVSTLEQIKSAAGLPDPRCSPRTTATRRRSLDLQSTFIEDDYLRPRSSAHFPVSSLNSCGHQIRVDRQPNRQRTPNPAVSIGVNVDQNGRTSCARLAAARGTTQSCRHVLKRREKRAVDRYPPARTY